MTQSLWSVKLVRYKLQISVFAVSETRVLWIDSTLVYAPKYAFIDSFENHLFPK